MRDQGAHITRIDIQVMLHEILTRLPDITPALPAEWLPSNFISGPRRLLSRTGHGRIAAQIGHRLPLRCQFRLDTRSVRFFRSGIARQSAGLFRLRQ